MKRRSRSDEDHGNGSASADSNEYEPDTQIAEKHTLTWMGDLCDTFQTTNRVGVVDISALIEVYDNYSHNRQVPMKEPIVEDLHLMVKASGKCLRIYEYIRDHSAYRVTRRDVTNLMVTIRSVLRGEVDDDLAVDKFLLDIEQDDPGIVTS
ncbi:hypothetical protein JG687_00012492, partial [Phytophthora cactorum]